MTLALMCCRAGFATVLEDVLPGNLRRAAARVDAMLPEGLHFATSIEDAVRHADLVIDTVPDELESKLEILSLLDRMAPPAALFATPTASLSIADLASCTYRPGQCFGLQFSVSVQDSGWCVAIACPPAASVETRDMLKRFFLALGTEPELSQDNSRLP